MLRTFPHADSPAFNDAGTIIVDPENNSVPMRCETILAFMRTMKRAVGKYEIWNHLGAGYNEMHVQYALTKLLLAGKLQRVKHGNYALTAAPTTRKAAAARGAAGAAPPPPPPNGRSRKSRNADLNRVRAILSLSEAGVSAERIARLIAGGFVR